MEARPDILNHNLETVRAAPEARPQARPLGAQPRTSCERAKAMAREIGYPVHTKSRA